ncbi:hypothetical protein VNO78_31972 [Psophocarpus tetragonolobus]|uniref:Uncharacterized protein n=1 Tax=Psophocarpus tetragonolobus TaxID=3891 RepID=A0AAN9X868_PSOTE
MAASASASASATGLFNTKLKVGLSRISSQDRSPLGVKVKAAQWASLQAEIEAHLRKSIPVKEPVDVFEPMKEVALGAPVSSVPAICLAACEVVGGERRKAMAAASALLLNLANAHAHEQVVLADAVPAPGPGYGRNIQLLTGDAIVPFGFELLAKDEASSERVLRVIIEISHAVGSGGLLGAQHMKKTLDLDLESARRVVEKKEGALHACGAACGAILGGGTEDDIQRLRLFGFHVGIIRGMLQRGFNHQQVHADTEVALHQLQFFNPSHLLLISTFIHS